jgi:uncharacterized phiE125 gp8 family phage protein
MARSLKIETKPTLKLVTVTECKNFLRVDFTDDDNYISDLIDMAIETIENYCNISIYEQTLVQQCDLWEETFNLLRSPIQNSGDLTVEHIKYYDENDVQRVWDASNYNVDTNMSPARIYLKDDSDSYPTIATRIFPIEVKYKSGTDAVNSAPKILKQACLLIIGQFYENRQPYIVGRSVSEIPMTVKYLLDKHKIQTFGLPNEIIL